MVSHCSSKSSTKLYNVLCWLICNIWLAAPDWWECNDNPAPAFNKKEHPDKTACASDTQKRLKRLPEVIELERILNEWIGHESHLSTEQLWVLAARALEKSTRAPFEGAGGKFHNRFGFGILQCIWDNNTPQQLRLFKDKQLHIVNNSNTSKLGWWRVAEC